MVEKKEGGEINAKLALALRNSYNVTLIKAEKFESLGPNFARNAVQKIVNDKAIEELFISESSIDLSMNKNKT